MGLDDADVDSEFGNPQSAIDGVPGVTMCQIPPLDEAGTRIMELRRKLITLQDLVDPGTILKMHDATSEDIELLAFIEAETAKLQPEKPGKNE
jgi:hypothetical protein